ncbi:KIF-binding protein [Halictus rubicundus]|uniref:KIF-binding protein n=1 Tax=Halictus rubicundus TaxID=77578 RepID=UPI0040351C8D
MEGEVKTDKHVNLKEIAETYKKLLEGNDKDKTLEYLKMIEEELSNMREECNDAERKKEVTLVLATVNLNLGTVLSDLEELRASEERLMKCIDLLQDLELEMKEKIYPLVHALNLLGIIWSQWDQPEKAKDFLLRSEQAFVEYTSNKDYELPDNIDKPRPNPCIYNHETEDEKIRRESFEGLYTETLCYLAQVYRTLDDHAKTALYCHRTLSRQLCHNKVTEKLDYVDWALNAATLSQYFLKIEGFTQARHHLAAASYILQTYENILKKKTEENPESEAIAAEWENFKHRSADVAMCWAKYGILLLDLSWQRLLQKNEIDEDNNEMLQETNNKDISELESVKDLKFNDLEETVKPIASQITDQYLLDFNDARLVFLNIKKWLVQAESYYTLNEHASDHVLIAQDLAQAYYYLSFFEDDEDKQAKMHKRRVDVLEDVVKELNPQYYQSACRQIWIRLGEAYSNILDIKLDRLKTTERKPQAVAKINRLAHNSIKYFQKFLDSLEHCPTDPKMQEFPEEVLRPALSSYFNIGRLYGKIICNTHDALDHDKAVQISYAEKSINALKFVVDYCDKYPAAADIMKPLLYLCKEFVTLSTVRLNNLKAAMIK